MKAFQVVFPHAVHLRCSNHLRQNVKDKLHALAIPQNLWKDFLSDIFGQQVGTQYEKGLVDSESPEVFKNALARLESRWNNLESSVSERDPQFHSWFAQYKADIIANSVLPPVREKAGYVSGKIGEKFTTNVSESLNHVIKQEVEWKESKLPILVEHLKAITNQHEAEMEKAVIGRGEWRFIELYKHFEVDDRIWFPKTSLECRQKHMKKIKSCKLMDVGETSSSVEKGNSSFTLSVSPLTLHLNGTISQHTLKGIWKKAEMLLATPGNVIKIPWSDNPRSRLIKSLSSEHPHVVDVKKGYMYFCDDKCPMFKSYHICSHLVAAAEDNGELKSFLGNSGYLFQPNLTTISNEGMPAGSGRKGGRQKRKRKSTPAVESVSYRPCFQRNSSSLPQKQLRTASSASPFLPSNESTVDSITQSPQPSNSVSASSMPPVSIVVSMPTSVLRPCVSNISGQVNIGSGLNVSTNTPQNLPGINTSLQNPAAANPFTLKLKTNAIKICQACRKGFDGANDTLGLAVARSERRLILNTVTGSQFWGRESNSHYHCHMNCLRMASPQFEGKDLLIPDAVKAALSVYQKVYLITCLQISSTVLEAN